jgi:hypothetical protein
VIERSGEWGNFRFWISTVQQNSERLALND